MHATLILLYGDHFFTVLASIYSKYMLIFVVMIFKWSLDENLFWKEIFDKWNYFIFLKKYWQLYCPINVSNNLLPSSRNGARMYSAYKAKSFQMMFIVWCSSQISLYYQSSLASLYLLLSTKHPVNRDQTIDPWLIWGSWVHVIRNRFPHCDLSVKTKLCNKELCIMLCEQLRARSTACIKESHHWNSILSVIVMSFCCLLYKVQYVKGAYIELGWIEIIASHPRGATLKGKNLLSLGANSSL